MKKILSICFIVVLTLLLTGCSSPKETEKPDLTAIKADDSLKDILYNEVCFNQYKVETKWNKPHYKYTGVKCYYINVNDYPESIEDTEITIFKDRTFSGILKSDLTKDGKIHNTTIYKAFQASYKELPAFCRVNDDNEDYCLSLDWEVNDGVSERYALIRLNEE